MNQDGFQLAPSWAGRSGPPGGARGPPGRRLGAARGYSGSKIVGRPSIFPGTTSLREGNGMDTHAGSPQPESAEVEWADAGSLGAESPGAGSVPGESLGGSLEGDSLEAGRQRWQRRFAGSRIRAADFSTPSGLDVEPV